MPLVSSTDLAAYRALFAPAAPSVRKPRAADVARWVATLAASLPSPFMRCDYRDARKAQTNARSALRSWGLRDDGTTLLAAEDYDHAAGVEAEVLAQRAAVSL